MTKWSESCLTLDKSRKWNAQHDMLAGVLQYQFSLELMFETMASDDE